jgi:hypothetical protein
MKDGAPRWELSAPESQILLSGPETRDDWALKAALLELVVRGGLRLSTSESSGILRRKRAHVLVLVKNSDLAAIAALRGVLDAYPQPRLHSNRTAVAVGDLARAVFTRYQKAPSGGYVNEILLPALDERGLFSREADPRLRLAGAGGWFLTQRGLAALVELRSLLASAREAFGAWLDRDHPRADAFLQTAGPATLLMDDAIAALGRLRERSSAEPHARNVAASSAGAFSLGALAGVFGPGLSDGLDGANKVINAGVDEVWRALHRSSGE